MNGLFGLNTTDTFNCRTAKCTWDEAHMSLGVATTCLNVTDTVTPLCESDNALGRNCRYTTPGGITFNTTRYHGSARFVSSVLKVVSRGQSQSNSTEIAKIAVWRSTKPNTDISIGNITECSFSWVAHIYDAVSVLENKFKIGTKSVVSLESQPGLKQVGPQMFVYFKAAQGSTLDVNFTVNVANLITAQDYLTNTIFNASLMEPVGPGGGENWGMAQSVLYNGNVTKIAESIALSMSDYIRNGPNSTEAHGIAHHDETFIHVQWAWLILPISLVLASIVLLVGSIILNRQHKTVLWKSSSLALLFHSLEGWDKDELNTGTVSTARAESIASRLRVQLADNLSFSVDKQ
jgi:hypothetical protein